MTLGNNNLSMIITVLLITTITKITLSKDIMNAPFTKSTININQEKEITECVFNNKTLMKSMIEGAQTTMNATKSRISKSFKTSTGTCADCVKIQIPTVIADNPTTNSTEGRVVVKEVQRLMTLEDTNAIIKTPKREVKGMIASTTSTGDIQERFKVQSLRRMVLIKQTSPAGLSQRKKVVMNLKSLQGNVVIHLKVKIIVILKLRAFPP